MPGIADARIQQAFQAPALNVAFNRMMAGMVGLTEHDAAASMQNSLAGSSQTTPILAESAERRQLCGVVQTPQYRIDTLDGLKTMPVTTTGTVGPIARRPRHDHSRTGERRRLALQYPPRRSTSSRRPKDATLAGSPADIQKILDETRAGWGKGVRAVVRGQVADDGQALSRALRRPGRSPSC